MSKIYKTFTTLVLLIAPVVSGAAAVDDEFHRNRMVENLRLASLWLIEEGVHTFKSSGKKGIHRKLVDDWGVQIWVDPWIESERYIDGFWIKARGINHEVINFHREEVGSDIYEFWIVKVDGQDWAGVDSRAMFFIARADDIYGKREIIHSSEQFIEQYRVDATTVIRFPVDDPQVLYELQAWRYPGNFQNSELKDVRAEMTATGEIRLVGSESQ